MELRQLSYFVAVAEEGSFTRGAARVNVVQSAASAAVARLERHLGVRLFDRAPGHLALTDAGQLLLARSRRLLAEALRAHEEVQQMGGNLRGVVDVGIVLSTGTLDLPAILAKFLQAHPSVTVRLHVVAGPLGELLNDLVDSRVQLMLVPVPARTYPGVRLVPVAHVRQVLACPLGHPLATAERVSYRDLAGHSFIDFPSHWGNRHFTDALLEREGVTKAVTIEVDNVAAAMRLVRRGLGIAFLPVEEVTDDPLMASVDLVSPPGPMPLALALATDRPNTLATTALFSTIKRGMAPIP